MSETKQEARLNQVRLVLPVIPGEPVVEIDGLALQGVLGAQIEHKPDAGTILHLTLLAHITCETALLPAEDDEALSPEWEFMGELGGYTYEKNRKTGDQRRIARDQSHS